MIIDAEFENNITFFDTEFSEEQEILEEDKFKEVMIVSGGEYDEGYEDGFNGAYEECAKKLEEVYQAIENKVDKTTTIAGIDLFDSITTEELAETLDLYIVNFTQNNDGKWSADKSFDEICNAIKKDKVIIGLCDGKQCACVNNNEQEIKFLNTETTKIISITIHNDNLIDYKEQDYIKNEEITNDEMLNLWNTIMK